MGFLALLDGERGFGVSAETTSGDVSAALDGEYSVVLHDAESAECTIFDTYEWSLWHDGILAVRAGDRLSFFERHGETVGGCLGEVEVSGEPGYAWDLDAGELGERLATVMKLRKLIPMVECRLKRDEMEVRNPEGKMVLRAGRIAFSSLGEAAPFAVVLHFSPLRGYEAEAKRVRDLLSPMREGVSIESPLATWFRLASIQPRTYTLRPEFGFSEDDSARDAVRRIVAPILGIARENEAGVIEDVDTEFLHDYRICIRKVRSVISLIKGVYPDADTQFLKDELGAFARETNRLRDLDVYLLTRSSYEVRLPAALGAGMAELFEDFAADRAREQKRVAKHLQSAAYRARRAKVEAYFAPEAKHAASLTSEIAIGDLAAERIYKRYRRIIRAGRAIGTETPDAAIHELRIECKKLRYLLEFFSEIFPEPEVKKTEKLLRRLQNRLGTFNDLSVQQAALLEYLRKTRHPKGHNLVLAVGGLVGVLYGEQQREREGIAEALNEFCAPALAAEVKARFKSRKASPRED